MKKAKPKSNGEKPQTKGELRLEEFLRQKSKPIPSEASPELRRQIREMEKKPLPTPAEIRARVRRMEKHFASFGGRIYPDSTPLIRRMRNADYR